MSDSPRVKVLLLAAGLGTRLRPLTNSIPKCLVPIMERPLLGYWLELLEQAGVPPENVLVNLHYFPEPVREFLAGHTYGARVTAIFEEELLGTAGTLHANAEFFQDADAMMLVHADNLSLFSLKDFLNKHAARPDGVAISMMSFETDAPQTCGIVELDESGVVQAFHEKQANPPGNLANGAVYILDGALLDFLAQVASGRENGFIDFSLDVIPEYMGRIQVFLNDIYHRDIGNLPSLEQARAEFPAVYDRFHKRG